MDALKPSLSIRNGGRPRPAFSTRGEKGFSALMTALMATVLFGMLGLAFDMGRMFIAKNEVQTFADAAALAACKNLDGTSTGLAAAHSVVTNGPLSSTPNAWNFATTTITNVTDTYSTSFTGTYDSYATAVAKSPNSYRFLNVSASVNVPIYFLAVIPGVGLQQTVAATSTAGEMALSGVTDGGLAPFSPDAHDPSDTTNFGFVPNQEYTLKWGNGNTTTCAGDAGFNPQNAPDAHGFVNLGQ